MREKLFHLLPTQSLILKIFLIGEGGTRRQS